jgi:glutathione reductase (NADPH)
MAYVATAFGGKPTPVDHELIATAVFTTPEIGAVGLTETRALEKGHSIDVYKSTFRPLKNTLSGRNERSVMKVIVDQKTDKVLGCHLFSPHAGDMIQLVGVALKMGATKAQFDATVAVHPSAAEELVTMRSKSYSKEP